VQLCLKMRVGEGFFWTQRGRIALQKLFPQRDTRAGRLRNQRGTLFSKASAVNADAGAEVVSGRDRIGKEVPVKPSNI